MRLEDIFKRAATATELQDLLFHHVKRTKGYVIGYYPMGNEALKITVEAKQKKWYSDLPLAGSWTTTVWPEFWLTRSPDVREWKLSISGIVDLEKFTPIRLIRWFIDHADAKKGIATHLIEISPEKYKLDPSEQNEKLP